MKIPNPDLFADFLRAKAVKVDERKVFISKFMGTDQEKDLTKRPNCGGFGRIHHFKRNSNTLWVDNPLPMDPAGYRLSFEKTDVLQVQVFQVGACNLRCWYCFVDDLLLSVNEDKGKFLGSEDIFDLYQKEELRFPVIDLTGGQPGLVPEWTIWMMKEAQERGLGKKIYFWEDDNLSNDFLWRFINDDDLAFMVGYENYGRVGCFKGFDEDSFSLNTSAPPEFFKKQFEIMHRLISLGLDMYAYVTFTTRDIRNLPIKISKFVDKLQQLDRNLPLRTIPLEIKIFSPTAKRIKENLNEILRNQYTVCEVWSQELYSRFSEEELSQPIMEHRIGNP